jgi:AmmeMemoRadiSam system protein A
VCSIVFETEDGAHGTDGLHAEKTVSFSQAEVNNDRCPYTALARKAVESYVSDGTVIDVSDALMDGLASEMTERKAGVFVSLKIGGQLRGCIGTIAPTQSSIAEEIIANGISAAVRDPRFPPVSLSELPELTYSVDVLGESEQVHSLSMLDIKRYGVIISSGVKRGLLLPDLDGVDSVEEQIDIAMRKGGIQKDDDISVQRFEVVRFREQRK